MKLSKVQERALNKFVEDKWYSAYELSEGLNTLCSLEMKGLLKSKRPAGSDFFPRVMLQFKKTNVVANQFSYT